MSSKGYFFSLLAPVAIFSAVKNHVCKFARENYEVQFCGVTVCVVGRVSGGGGGGGVCGRGGGSLGHFPQRRKIGVAFV